MQRNDQGMLMQALMSMQGEREPMDQSGTYAAKAADEGALDAWKTVVGAREGRARMANERGAGREQLVNALQRAQMQAEAERARQALMAQMNAQKLAQEREMQGLQQKFESRNDPFNQRLAEERLAAEKAWRERDAEARENAARARAAGAGQPRGTGMAKQKSPMDRIQDTINEIGKTQRDLTSNPSWANNQDAMAIAMAEAERLEQVKARLIRSIQLGATSGPEAMMREWEQGVAMLNRAKAMTGGGMERPEAQAAPVDVDPFGKPVQ